MRSLLVGTGALLFLAYPLVMLFAVAANLDQAQQNPPAAAIILTPRSSSELLERDSGQWSRGELRNATIRKPGN